MDLELSKSPEKTESFAELRVKFVIWGKVVIKLILEQFFVSNHFMSGVHFFMCANLQCTL